MVFHELRRNETIADIQFSQSVMKLSTIDLQKSSLSIESGYRFYRFVQASSSRRNSMYIFLPQGGTEKNSAGYIAFRPYHNKALFLRYRFCEQSEAISWNGL
jgi:hypothetical protein